MSTSPDKSFGDMSINDLLGRGESIASEALREANDNLRITLGEFTKLTDRMRWFTARWGKWILGFVALCMALSTASLVVLAVCAVL